MLIKKYVHSTLLCLGLTLLFPLNSKAQFVINEFMGSNTSAINDPDFEESADWIEIHNLSANAENLHGYFLTDNISNENKWEIKVDTLIPSGGFVLIWADGQDTLLHASFKLSQAGEEIGLFSPALVKLDSLIYPVQKTDVSMGRKPNGSGNFYFFTEPTPGSSNTTPSFHNFTMNEPDFSMSGGLFSGEINVAIKNTMGGEVRYTLDGSEPELASALYSAPFHLDTTTIIRARVFKNNEIPGPVVTQSYFFDDHLNAANLPVFSMATHPDNFWDPVKGIYVQDFKPEWEIPVNIEFFENDGSDRAAFNIQAGVKVNGLYSWQLPQKMLGIYFRGKYGTGKLEYPLLFQDNRSYFGSFALRASGNDWSNTLFKDAMLQQSTQLNTGLDIQQYRPSVLYVNGQYMGIHNIRNKVDNEYIESGYGLPSGSFDMIENEDYVEAGSLTEYQEFRALYKKDLSIQENFDAVAAQMDIENFTDFAITEIYSRNTSIGHNVMAWKPKDAGKWKWIVMDLDRGMGDASTNMLTYFRSFDIYPLDDLLDNENYQEYFAGRLADQLYTTFHPDRMKMLIDSNKAFIEKEVPEHIKRWEGTTSSYGNAIPSYSYWLDEICALKGYADARPLNMLEDLDQLGYNNISNLNLAVFPANAGKIQMNNLHVPGESWCGPYPQEIDINLNAIPNAGFKFLGWDRAIQKSIVPKNSSWKYNDKGIDLGNNWYSAGFNDVSWSAGNAQFGFGDGDEATVVSFGSNPDNKYITTYFRKIFELTTSDIQATAYAIHLLCDDGAVVYINGKQAVKYNMECGDISFASLANTSIGGSDENLYKTFIINPDLLSEGENSVAVEVHQADLNSSDLSFDMELVSYTSDKAGYLTTDNLFEFSLENDTNLIAVFEAVSACFLPPVISENTTLTSDCSPVFVNADVVVNKGVTLTIGQGVKLYMAPESHLIVNGRLLARGTASNQVVFEGSSQNQGDSWGNITIKNSADTSSLKYVTIKQAGGGYHPVTENAAMAIYNANVVMDHMDITDVNSNPIAARYGHVVLTNSKLHSKVTGDLINVKYGKAYIRNCEFRGNEKIDMDAIDYDDVENGIIRNCRIFNFHGFNSDAIDVGEKAKNVLIDSVFITNITDKGVSFGQQSTGKIINSVFVSCNLGLGLKDSCQATIENCTFYNVGIPVSAYEKNVGSAGGNGSVLNSILSNSIYSSYSVDDKSSLSISYSISDNDSLPLGFNNLFGNPKFEAPALFNFNPESTSPVINAANSKNGYLDLGANLKNIEAIPEIVLDEIYTNYLLDSEKAEYLGFKNISSENKDISGYYFSNGIEYVFPSGTVINAGERFFVTKIASAEQWDAYGGKLFPWTLGNLANEGENIVLNNKFGIVIDRVRYNNKAPWPEGMVSNGDVLYLVNVNLDNHLAENWKSKPFENIVNISHGENISSIVIYPNPTYGKLNIQQKNNLIFNRVEVYDLTGKQLVNKEFTGVEMELDLAGYNEGVYFVKVGESVQKIVLLK